MYVIILLLLFVYFLALPSLLDPSYFNIIQCSLSEKVTIMIIIIIIMMIDDLERNLLPLHGLTDKWENGKVLVTTSNAGVIPQNNIDTVSTVGIEPLSIEESAKLIGRLAGYNLNEREKESLKAAVNTKQWRCLPLIMAG